METVSTNNISGKTTNDSSELTNTNRSTEQVTDRSCSRNQPGDLKTVFMDLVHELLLFLQKTEISKSCKNVDISLNHYADFGVVVRLVLAYFDSYSKNPQQTLELFMHNFGFQRTH